MDKNLRRLFSASQIQKRVKEIGRQITEDYKGKSPVVICTLKGAVHFFSDLTRSIKLPLNFDFVQISSYRSGTVSGKMELVKPLLGNLAGKDVIIVEDIVDSGNTLSFFTKELQKQNPTSLKICTFLDKKERRQTDITPDYCCFEVPDLFIVGYGLDFAEKYRELPFVAELINPTL